MSDAAAVRDRFHTSLNRRFKLKEQPDVLALSQPLPEEPLRDPDLAHEVNAIVRMLVPNLGLGLPFLDEGAFRDQSFRRGAEVVHVPDAYAHSIENLCEHLPQKSPNENAFTGKQLFDIFTRDPAARTELLNRLNEHTRLFGFNAVEIRTEPSGDRTKPGSIEVLFQRCERGFVQPLDTAHELDHEFRQVAPRVPALVTQELERRIDARLVPYHDSFRFGGRNLQVAKVEVTQAFLNLEALGVEHPQEGTLTFSALRVGQLQRILTDDSGARDRFLAHVNANFHAEAETRRRERWEAEPDKTLAARLRPEPLVAVAIEAYLAPLSHSGIRGTRDPVIKVVVCDPKWGYPAPGESFHGTVEDEHPALASR